MNVLAVAERARGGPASRFKNYAVVKVSSGVGCGLVVNGGLARPAVVSALKSLARDDAYEHWLLARQRAYDYATLCYRDQQPTPGVLPLTDYLPFLAAE